ncbi:MAG TPA: maleylpyruvate isomerase N-terminal domain-containing protein [Acidimicrobiales bacterium]|nr:maleylpyruvate isomerase N-terminal domain-containing protein [Acidimicrobiales bacterium]
MDFLAAIRTDAERFYDVAEGADPTRPVPSCPAWTVADLAWHLGEVHWFWGTDVETRAGAPDEVEAAKPDRPATHAEVVTWGRAQAERMLGILDTTPDDVAVWTWAMDESGHNVGFVRRHQVQEAAVHRWDMENAATGRPQPVEPDAAADAVDEVLAITLPWGVRPEKPLSGSVHLHCTDVEGEWFVHPEGQVERAHAKGDVAIRGTASDLLLALYTRVPLNGLDVIGDAAVAHELVARLNTD